MADLTIADFAPWRGGAVGVETDAGPLPFVLADVHELAPSPREAGSFRLELHGPAEPVLSQGIYPIRVGEARHAIFIVPIARRTDGISYEAIFF